MSRSAVGSTRARQLRVVFTFLMEAELYERMRRYSFERGKPMSEVVRRALSEYLSKEGY